MVWRRGKEVGMVEEEEGELTIPKITKKNFTLPHKNQMW